MSSFEKQGTCKSTAHRISRLQRTVLIVAALLTLPMAAHCASATRTSAFDYDAATGLLIKEIVEPTSSALCVVTSYQIDAYGNKTAATTRNCNGSTGSSPANNSEAAAPSGLPVFAIRQTTTTYADPRFPTTVSNALKHSETRSYNSAFGVPVSLTGPNGLTTQWAYDGFGRKVIERRSDGNGTQWSYKLCASVPGGTETCPAIGVFPAMYVVTTTPVSAPIDITAKTVGPQNGPYVKAYFDAQNRLIRQETQGADLSGSAATVYEDTEYNLLGQVTGKTRPYFVGDTAYWTRSSYDALGRVVQTTTPDGGQATNAYNGLTTSVTIKVLNAPSAYSPATQTTTETRNLVGQVVQVTNPSGKVLRRSFDPFGNLVETQDPAGNVTTLTYDAKGRKTSMQDPDMGSWAYDYNALGELVWQRNAKNQITTTSYDVLGRVVSRTEPDLISNWAYDAYADGTVCNKGIGQLCETSTSTGYRRRFSFDAQGRPASAVTYMGSVSYSAGVSYDANGRIDIYTYPSGFQVRNSYSALGYLKQVADMSGISYWQANVIDAAGRVVRSTAGNGIVTSNSYEATTGRLTGTSAGPSNTVQNDTYGYDYIGNVRVRFNGATGVTAQYDYDALNRLRSETRSGGALASAQTIAWTYDDIGNLTSRSDVGSYTYPPSGPTSVRPHAVSSVSGTVNGVANPSYSYDANGNLSAGGGRSVGWMSFDMPSSVTRGAAVLSWLYGSEHQRVRETYSLKGTVQRTTTYLHGALGGGLSYEEETGVAGTKKKHYINAGNATLAVVVIDGNMRSTQYWQKDHLGSVVAVVNESGTVVERMDYEPFGKRRYSNGNTDAGGTLSATSTDRGYTGHEMLDEVGLIHMNGRLYDPAVSRFVSADPLIQAPTNLQSFNRYTYGWNNPLGGTDPSGYSWLSKRWHEVWHSTAGRMVITIAAAYFTGQYVSGWLTSGDVGWAATSMGSATCTATPTLLTAGNIAVGAAGGFAGGFVGSGGNVKEGLEGAVTGAAMGWAGGVGEAGSTARYAAHAAVGCGSGMLSGSGCVRGATAAFAAKWATVHTKNWPMPAQFAATVVTGGTVSVIGGGKFANGAQTAAYGYLFNYCAHNGCFDRRFDFNDAVDQWRNGNGSTVTDVKASELNLTDATYTKNPDGSYQVHTSIKFDTGAIYGTVTGALNADGTMSIKPDIYDFDQKNPFRERTPQGFGRVVLRDALTAIGAVVNGPGVPYRIEFTGTIPAPKELLK